MPQRTPGAWLELLEARLHQRWNTMVVFDAYYEGDHKLAFATASFREAFGSLFAALSDNWCRVAVDAKAERLRVQGFRFGDEQEADKEAWEMWQANGLDAESNMLHTEAIKLGEAYWMVTPNGEMPKITAEHPSQVIVACEPGDRKSRLAALKKWVDGKTSYANVYLPDRVVKYQSQQPHMQTIGGKTNWQQIEIVSNPLEVVPIVPMRNNPSMLRGGQSDLAGGAINIQNAVNKLLSDMMIGSEYQAFPQRVLAGLEIPRNEDGTPKRAFELQFSQARALVFGDKEVKWGEFKAADLDNYAKGLELLVSHFTAQTRTPPHYVAGKLVNVSGDALKAAETGLVAKAEDAKDPFGEGHEETVALGFKARDPKDPRAGITNAETIWKDSESRSQAELADALVKLSTIGVPEEILWERYGFSPTEIDRMKSIQEAEALLNPPPVLMPPPMNGDRAVEPAFPPVNR